MPARARALSRFSRVEACEKYTGLSLFKYENGRAGVPARLDDRA